MSMVPFVQLRIAKVKTLQESTSDQHLVTLTITTEKGNTKTITIAQNYKVVVLNTAEIKDFDKYLCPESTNPHFEKGADFMLCSRLLLFLAFV